MATQIQPTLYCPLNQTLRQVRFIIIEASNDPDLTNSTIECSMKIFSLNHRHRYFALSYVWGDNTITENILVNTVWLRVTINLAVALRQLRDAMAPSKSYLWVDAICINQHDISERASQVQLMGDIYRDALKVVSWIGSDADRCVEALSILKSMAKEVASLGQDDDHFDWLQRYPTLLEEKSDLSTIWDAFDHIWDRDYWKRTWVMQETVLAKEILIMCGPETVSWEDILIVYKWANSIGSKERRRPSYIKPRLWRLFASQSIFNARPIVKSQLFRNMWHTPNSNITEIGLRVLDICRELQATDPRDKVYGLLGLTQVDLIPDYAKPIRDVYIEAALKYLQLSGLTRTLNQAGIDQGSKFRLPSWVPDWSLSSQHRVVPLTVYSNDGLNKDSNYFIVDTTESVILNVTGTQLSEVQEVEPQPTKHDSVPLIQRTWRFCLYSLTRYGDRLYPTGIPPLQAILRLVLDNEDPLNDDAEIQIPSDAFFRLGAAFVGVLCSAGENTQMEFDERCQMNLPKLGLAGDQDFAPTFSKQFLGSTSLPGPWEYASQALWDNFASYFKISNALSRTLHGKFFLTTDNYIGIGPSSAQPGDIVCKLKGCHFLVILRKEDTHFVLIGTCFVEGLRTPSSLVGSTELQNFELR